MVLENLCPVAAFTNLINLLIKLFTIHHCGFYYSGGVTSPHYGYINSSSSTVSPCVCTKVCKQTRNSPGVFLSSAHVLLSSVSARLAIVYVTIEVVPVKDMKRNNANVSCFACLTTRRSQV